MMDAETKRQAIEFYLEKTKGRNYRRNTSEHLIRIIVQDVMTVMSEWTGPVRSEPQEE